MGLGDQISYTVLSVVKWGYEGGLK